MIGYLALFALFGLIIGVLARKKGRSFAAWFIYGALLFLPALIHILVVKDAGKKCSACLSVVPKEATVCRFCQHKFTEAEFKAMNERYIREHKHDGLKLAIAAILIFTAIQLIRFSLVGHF